MPRVNTRRRVVTTPSRKIGYARAASSAAKPGTALFSEKNQPLITAHKFIPRLSFTLQEKSGTQFQPPCIGTRPGARSSRFICNQV
jgi:hypothetical protein